MLAGGNVVHYGGVLYDSGIFVLGAGDGDVFRVVEVSVHHYAITRGGFVYFIDDIGGHQGYENGV